MLSIVVILVVMLAINLAMIFAVIRLSTRTGDNLQKFFLDKTGYLFDVNEKEEVVEEKKKEDIVVKTDTPIILMSSDIDNTRYKSDTFNDEYKNIRSEMDFDRDSVVMDVINEEDDEQHEFAEAILSINDSFDFETIYELGTVSSFDQVKVLKEVFNKKQNEFLASYINSLGNKEFNIVEFFNTVKENAKLVDSNYYVKTAWDHENYEDLGDNVVTVHDENIVEGIKVVHKNKMYDYSI